MKKKSKPIHTDITVVLDSSGSMDAVKSATISGFNEFLADQKKVEGEASLSLVTFNYHVTDVIENEPIAKVRKLNSDTYIPGGTTALFDAMGKAIQDAKDRNPSSKKIVVVMTDGLENASRFFSRAKVFEMVTQCKELGWEFVFLGANQDAFAEGGSVGVQRANAMTVSHTNEGYRAAYRSVSSNMAAVRTGSVDTMAFSAADYQAQEEAK